MRKYLIGAGILIVLVFIVILLWPKTKHTAVFNSSRIATNIQMPYLEGRSTLYYFSGEAFVKYDLAHNTTSPLTPQYSLPTIEAIKWSHGGAFFKASGYSSVDDLYQQLVDQQLDPNGSYWWFCDFTTGKITLAYTLVGGHRVDDISWRSASSGDFLFTTNTLSANNYEHGIQTSDDDGLYLFSNGAAKELVPNSGAVSVIVGVAGNSAYYVSQKQGGRLVRVDLSSLKATSLSSHAIAQAALSGDQQYVIYTSSTAESGPKTGDNAPANLYAINLLSGKDAVLIKNFSGVFSGDNHGYVLASYTQANQQAQTAKIDLTTQKQTVYTIKELDPSETAQSLIPIDLGADNFLLTNSTNRLFHYSQTEQQAQPSPNYEYRIQGDIYKDGYEISYDADKDVYAVYIKKGPYKTVQQAVLQYIRSQQIDPNQIPIKWYSYDNVDRSQ